VGLSAFIDVEGVFDNTGFDSIMSAAERKQIDPEIIRILECIK
jgi:hypothetical protein